MPQVDFCGGTLTSRVRPGEVAIMFGSAWPEIEQETGRMLWSVELRVPTGRRFTGEGFMVEREPLRITHQDGSTLDLTLREGFGRIVAFGSYLLKFVGIEAEEQPEEEREPAPASIAEAKAAVESMRKQRRFTWD